MYIQKKEYRSNNWTHNWTVSNSMYRDGLLGEANTKLKRGRNSSEVLNVLAWLRDANKSLQELNETSIISSIETTLWSVTRMGIVVRHPSRVREYLIENNDMLGMLLPMSEALMAHFEGDAQIFLELFQDPDADDEFLMFTVRIANYPEDILDQLNSLASLFEEPLSERDGWILITTDFSQPG